MAKSLLQDEVFFEIGCEVLGKATILQGVYNKGWFCFKAIGAIHPLLASMLNMLPQPQCSLKPCPKDVFRTKLHYTNVPLPDGVVITNTGVTLNSKIVKENILQGLQIANIVYICPIDVDNEFGTGVYYKKCRLRSQEMCDLEECAGINKTDFSQIAKLTLDGIPTYADTSKKNASDKGMLRIKNRQRNAILLHVVRVAASARNPSEKLKEILGKHLDKVCELKILPVILDAVLVNKKIVTSSITDVCGNGGGTLSKKKKQNTTKP